MSNDISLTVRLPKELGDNLKVAAKKLGMTRTNLIRISIHDFLTKDEHSLIFPQYPSSPKERMVLNVNQITYDILERTCKDYGQSMNSVITAVSVLALERSSKWIESTKQ